MRFIVRVLGLDLLDIDLTTDQPAEDDTARDLSGGTLASNPVGFTAQPDDQRWEGAPSFE